MARKERTREGWISARGNFPKEGEIVFAYWANGDFTERGLAYHVVNEWFVCHNGDWQRGDVIGWIPVPEEGCFRDIVDSKAASKAEASFETCDNANHPAHHKAGSIELIDIMIAAFGLEDTRAFCKCSSFEHLWRHSKKNGLEDMEKAGWYLNKCIELSKLIKEGKDD